MLLTFICRGSRICLSILGIFVAVSLNASCAESFHIKGNTPSFADSTPVYLYALDNSQVLDSTLIIGGKFELVGQVNAKAIHVRLTLNEFRNAKKFWLEKGETNFELKGEKCAAAVIKGSKTQTEEDTLNAWLSPVATERERLNMAYYGDTSIAMREKITRQLSDLDSLEKIVFQKFILSFPSSLISANLLSVYSTVWGKNEVVTLFKLLTPENKTSQYGSEVNEFIHLNKNPKIGERYIDFQQSDTSGKKISLSAFDGNVVLLEFWASWCFGCMMENPKIISAYNNYKDKGFRVMAVSMDFNRESWLNGIRSNGLTWENVSDLRGAKNEVALIYGVGAIPDNFLIDKNGIIRGRNVSADKLPALLDVLVK